MINLSIREWFTYPFGVCQVVWTYNGEIYPTRFRGKLVAMATTANWAGNAGFRNVIVFHVPS